MIRRAQWFLMSLPIVRPAWQTQAARELPEQKGVDDEVEAEFLAMR